MNVENTVSDLQGFFVVFAAVLRCAGQCLGMGSPSSRASLSQMRMLATH